MGKHYIVVLGGGGERGALSKHRALNSNDNNDNIREIESNVHLLVMLDC